MAPYYYEEELFTLLTSLVGTIPSLLFSVATYVMTALAIYTISRRRGLKHPWIAWIPVINCWLLGSISDQYQYLVKSQNRSKRKWLLGLSILMAVLATVIVVMAIYVVGSVVFASRGNMNSVVGPLLSLIALCLPMVGVAIAYTVIRYIALYDVFRSLDPNNSVLFLVMSILFGITEPFFLFFNRNKDIGMPPRKTEPVYAQPVYDHPAYTQSQTQWTSQEVPQEPWEQAQKDYL